MKIQIGDIVEVQMSIVAVPVRGGQFKFTTLLRSVTLMDGTHTQVSRTRRTREKPHEHTFRMLSLPG
jgi:hypothetical protein